MRSSCSHFLNPCFKVSTGSQLVCREELGKCFHRICVGCNSGIEPIFVAAGYMQKVLQHYKCGAYQFLGTQLVQWHRLKCLSRINYRFHPNFHVAQREIGVGPIFLSAQQMGKRCSNRRVTIFDQDLNSCCSTQQGNSIRVQVHVSGVGVLPTHHKNGHTKGYDRAHRLNPCSPITPSEFKSHTNDCECRDSDYAATRQNVATPKESFNSFHKGMIA